MNLCLSVFAQNEGPTVARINGRSISQKQLDRIVVAKTLPLEEKIFAIRKGALENLITTYVLEDEAQKRGISVADLRKQLSAGEVNVTQSQVEDAYAENASFFAAMSPDEAKERLRLDLETQQRMQKYREALSALRKAARIESFLKEPRLPIVIDSGSPSLGNHDASVTIVEFSDFQCPYCRGIQATIRQVLQMYGKQVRLVFKHLPLQGHEQAFPAALAANCAGEQGMFWPFHNALFALETLSRDSLSRIATDMKVNQIKFTRCLESDFAASKVRQDMKEATQLGITSTPTFIINGRLVRGAANLEVFKSIIEQELKSAATGSHTPNLIDAK